jgi:putative membrane protein
MIEKGWGFYSTSPAFWLKMGLLGTITLLSLPPTFAYLRWSRAPQGATPPPSEIARLSRFLRAEAFLLIPVPVLAALMARGY